MSDFKHGWKTMLDGTRVPLTEQEAGGLWRRIQDDDERRAAAYPTTHDALKAHLDADQRMRDLGWSKTIIGLAEDEEIAVAEWGSTGIFRGFWRKPYLYYADCVASSGKRFIKRIVDLSDDEREQMDRCTEDTKRMIDAETKMFQRLQEYEEGTSND